MDLPLIDVVIPFYNAEATLARAVNSALQQNCLGTLWLIDDASVDTSAMVAQQFVAEYPNKVRLVSMPCNNGVAMARNLGAMLSAQSLVNFVAFLDADDAYENGALEAAAAVFHFQSDTSVVRLALKPIDLAARYAQHPNFDVAWQYMRMTCGGNTVFSKAFFLACGGFPTHSLFKALGGEDGALGIATTKVAKVATLFDDVGVLHFCREGMHAERLLDGILFGKQDANITADKLAEAEQVTEMICQRVQALKFGLNSNEIGIRPLVLERNT